MDVQATITGYSFIQKKTINHDENKAIIYSIMGLFLHDV